MPGTKEKMYWKCFFVFVCLFVGHCCENLWDNDGIENDQVMLESRILNGHYHRHSLRSDVQASNHQQLRVFSDDPTNGESAASFGAVDRKNVQRTKLRRRKMGSNYKKANTFRRGQRNRQNKNGFQVVSDMDYTSDADNNKDDEEKNEAGLWPPVVNVAPRAILHANATCGQTHREEFCHTIDAHPQRQRKPKCSVCDSHDADRRHPIDYVIDGSQKWWQSPTLNSGAENEYVTITMDLKQNFQVIFVSLKATISPRPASWILERSFDGSDYFPWQYFGVSDDDCRNRYNLPGQNEPYQFETDDQVICSTQFSKAVPLENGEIHIKVLEGRPGTKMKVIPTTLLDFTLARYLRFRFQGMHTTLQSPNSVQWLVDRDQLNKRSFYSLRYIKIGARLDCNGHARQAKQYNDDEVIECECVRNTCGVNCEKCCPLYNQKPYKQGTSTDRNACEKCECYGHSNECYYNPEVDQRGMSINTDGVYSGGGVCLNCTDLTTGINCEKCISNYYRPYGVSPSVKEPCIPCECNAIGTVGTCTGIGGACTCKTGFAGKKCSECAPGYSGQNCTKCPCDSRGTMPGGECESHCQCKLYVEGKLCDKCMPGYFGLSESNPEGCTKCYCSGVGNICESSNIVTNTYETLEDWKITDIWRSYILHPSKDNETGFLVFNMYEMSESVYWLAPDLYCGNKLQSYGSNFVFTISWVVVRGDTSGKPTFCPTLIIVGANGMRIAYGDNIFSETNSTISIQLTEHEWYQIPPTITEKSGTLRQNEYRGDYVTRSQFLAVLSNIGSVMLRGSFHTDQAESILIRASLEFSKGAKNELRSNLVEQCACPQGYIGLSCETCDFGYVRAYENTTSNQLGICLPCSCNGHAESCDLTTNKCSECAHNTTGERCESCAHGFYGNAKLGTPLDCRRCACPLLNDENNFSPVCQLRDSTFDQQNEVTSDYSLISYQNNDYVCIECPEGYIGDHCESCADGFYGVPTKLSSQCLKCPCNGGPCDPITGKCVTCQGNTEGWRCEQCKSGYFGNPAKMGCELCRCQSEGSENNECDSESGQCKCKKNYDGYQCDECAFGYANISLGCPACNCNSSGSIENFCDTHSGQCPCKMGVGGPKCDECVEGFYGLSTDGCQECHCNPLGSLAQNCNKHNGQCYCHENVTGRTCDKCSEGFWNLESGKGCQSCACNGIGSNNFSCNAYTGQCNCKPGVGGPKCDACLEGFYGYSANGCKRCDECSNSVYNCDPESGRCICPPHSKGIDCNQCMPNSYGWEHKIGCKLCECDHTGSIGQSCDLYTGQCLCREGFTGRQCNRCSIGYFGYPSCKRCGCNRDGSLKITNETEPISCTEDGQCPCKTLVTGKKCDECVESTFGLSKFNVDGCTRCFCFGRSNECAQSDFSWGLIRASETRCVTVEYQNIEYVALQSTDDSFTINYETNLQTIDGLSVIPGTNGNVSMKSSRGFETPLYFEMPKQFIGDRLMSYGGLFKFNVEMMECKTELDQITLQHFPLIRIHAYNSLTLDYFGPESFETTSNISQTIRMVENNWKLHPNGELATRGIFMTALQHITYILVRGASSVAFTSLTLSNVTLETAIFLSGSKNNLAIGVEMCTCPETYEGSSCQNPGDGYYRYRETITESSHLHYEHYVGISKPCDCNGRSNRCNKETGHCEMCANHTGGAHCGICADGYYGDPVEYGCQSCPCPETHRNFAKGCTFHHGRVSCSCRLGYIGDFCDSCAPGFFGSPEQEGGGCIDCNCNPFGSVSIECDAFTGDCMCRDGIIGEKCDKCAQQTAILDSGGCKVCDNCTLTLLESSNDLGHYIQIETRHIDLDSIPAPWSRLLSYENTTEHLIIRLNDITKSTEKVENYNDLQIDKLSSKGSNLNTRWQKMLTKAVKRSQISDNLKTIAITFWNEMEYVQNETQEHINMLNVFGIGSHHVNLPIALAESQQLLKGILGVVDSHNVAHRAHQCAVTLIDQWSNTSSILSDQMLEALQLKYDIINAKNRLYDLIQNVYKTSDTITNAKGIHAGNEKSYAKLLHQHQKIMQLNGNINEIYKANIIPETDTVFNMIGDNHQKLRQDLGTIIQLKTIVHDTETKSTQQLDNIRQEWLPLAQNYSNSLMNKAREYVGLFQNTKNSAEAAMVASTAYKNITDSVTMARDLITQAKETAVESENELYPKQDESIIEKSTKSLKKSQKIHQHSLKEMEKLEDLEYSLKSQWRKVDSIKNTIWQTGLRNNNLSLTLNSFSKNDTQEFLKRTIEAAQRVSEQMRDVRRSAIAITGTDIYKLKLKLASLEPQWAVKFGLAEENVSQSMRNIKDIKNTLSSIETASRRNDEKFHKWNETMSVLMQDLRAKIAKARHIADGIRVSLASKSAKCIRSYSLPTLGLATANSIKLSIALNSKLATTPILFMQGEDNRFLVIELVKRKIRFVWNLGGDTASITHPMELHKKDLNYDEAWYQIEANRTMNVGNLIVRQMGTGWTKPTSVQSAASQPESTRIIFTPNKRLWIGGVPNEIRPQELLAQEAGLNAVLSNVYIDEKRIGLWSFMHTEGDCDGATLGAREITSIDNARHFNGQGYSVVKKERSKPYKKNFFALQLTFKTLDENALLFLAIDEKNNRSISLTLYDGKIMFRIDYGGTSKLEISTAKKYNTGLWTSVEVAREFTSKRSTENGNLKVNNEEPLTGAPTTPITSSLLPDLSRAVYYLGGIPPDFKAAISKAPGADNAFLGCMKDIQINGESYDPLETSLRNGVEASCRETITRAGFYGNGFLELPNHSLRKRANIGFVFKTLQADALVLLAVVPTEEIANNYYDEKDLRSNYSFALVNGRIEFWADAGRGRIELNSNNTLNDGEYHTVNVLKMGRKFELRVDDEYQMSKSLSAQPFVINMIDGSGGFYVGGIPNVPDYLNLLQRADPFHGTIKDFVVNNQTISFGDLVNATSVDVGRDGPKMGQHELYNEMLMKTEPISKSFTAAPEGCHRVGSYSYEPNAFKFGDTPQSHSIINIGKQLWQTNFDIQFDFRTFYPNGMLFFVPGTKEKQKHFFTLILRNGQLNVVARGRKRIETIMSRKLNNGRWHRITLKCVNKVLTIRIHSDGNLNANDEEILKMPRRISASNNMYVGGIVESMLSFSAELTSKLEQFKGCIRRFLVNNISQDLAKPGKHFAIGQCFPNVEKGSYFAGDAYAIYKRVFQVGKYLELRFEFRTSEMQGMILSVAEPVGFPAISIELHEGKIIMSCDLGDGNPFRVESNVPSKYTLCDNNWHNVSAIYDSNQIAIRVDDLPSVNKLKQHETLGKVHTKSPLYIGGLPDTAPSGTLLNRDSFKGCIRNVVIRNELKDWTDMDEIQNVLLSECLIMS